MTCPFLNNLLIKLTPQSPLTPPEGDFLSFFVYFLSHFGGYGGLYLKHYKFVLFKLEKQFFNIPFRWISDFLEASQQMLLFHP